MFYAGILIFVVFVFWAYRMVNRTDLPSGDKFKIGIGVFVAGLMLYGLLSYGNPWHRGKRAFDWSRQLQEWRTDEEAEDAARALDEIGEPALAALSIALESKDAKVSKRSADIMAAVCSRSREYKQPQQASFKYLLLVMKESPDPSVRAHLAHAIAHCGPVAHNDAVIAGLESISRNDPDGIVRERAAQTLAIVQTLPKVGE